VALCAGQRMTYGELDVLSDGLAAGLEAGGVNPGDAVALQVPNIPQLLIAYFGILKAGAVAVPLNVLLKAPEVAFHLGDSSAKILITWEGGARGGRQRRRGGRGSARSTLSVTPPMRTVPRRSSGCSPLRGTGSGWLRGVRPTPRSSSTPRAPPDAPRAPSSPTASATS